MWRVFPDGITFIELIEVLKDKLHPGNDWGEILNRSILIV